MSAPLKKVLLQTSPHLRPTPPVDVIMRNVVFAMLPVCAYSVFQFGISALALILVCTLTCIATEHWLCRCAGNPSSTKDWSAAITGILLALTLPPGFPLWMAVISGVVGIAVGKMFFGGLGFNIMNPALVGRAFAQASFTVPITTWTPSMAADRFTQFIPTTLTAPFLKPDSIADWLPDGFSGATPLSLMKFENLSTDSIQLIFGTTAGSAGETSAILILLCGLYLIARNMMDWRITASILLSTFVLSGAFHLLNPELYPGPIFMICSGGLMLGAVFMATDMVGSPVTPLGVWIYGFVIAAVTVVIRLFGGLNEGVMYAILLGNVLSPLISQFTQPRVYGTGRAVKQKTA